MRIPLPPTLRNRGTNTDRDARALNCVVEDKRGTRRLVKRPALDQAFIALTGGGQLITTITKPDDDDEIVVITDDDLTNTLTASVKELSYFRGPDESDINVAITPSVIVHALNSLGQIATGYTGSVTMQLANNPTEATLGGTVTVAAVAGVATFSNLRVSRSGEGFTLRATEATGLRQPVSAPFNIPTRLVFTDQPDGAEPDTNFGCEITIQDPGGNTDTNYNGNVTVELFADQGATLSGTRTVAAVSGVATFTTLRINQTGTYELKATAEVISTAYPPASAVSSSFSIGQWTLTAANLVSISPDAYGFVSGTGGSISPTTLNGNTITGTYTIINLVPPNSYNAVGVLGLVAQSFFTSVTRGAVTLTTASATYSQAGGETLWEWTVPQTLVPSTGTFTVVFD